MFRFENPTKSRVSIRKSQDSVRIAIAKPVNGSAWQPVYAAVIFLVFAIVFLRDPGTWVRLFWRLVALAPFAALSIRLILFSLRTQLERDVLTIGPGTLTLQRAVLR